MICVTDMDPSTPCVDEGVCSQSCPAGYEDADCDAATQCSLCAYGTTSAGGTGTTCVSCGKACPPPPPLPPSPPPPMTCQTALAQLSPTHSRHDWNILPALPCLEVPPCPSGSVFANLEYIVQDGLDNPRGDGQQVRVHACFRHVFGTRLDSRCLEPGAVADPGQHQRC